MAVPGHDARPRWWAPQTANGLASRASKFNRLRYPLGSKLALGQRAVVRSTHQAQILGRIGAAQRPRALVMKLQESAPFTAPPIFADERTAMSVTRDDRTSHFVSQMGAPWLTGAQRFRRGLVSLRRADGQETRTTG